MSNIDVLRSNLEKDLTEISNEFSVKPMDAIKILKRNLVILDDVGIQEGIKQIDLKRSQDGNIIVSTTRKIPNLKYRLVDSIVESLETGISIVGSLDKPLLLILVGLKFLRKMRELSTVEIAEADARVLFALFSLEKQQNIVTVDALSSFLAKEINGAILAKSLANLESLGCLVLEDNRVKLIENIVITRVEK